MKIELLDLKEIGDQRGSLVSLESLINVPFDIKRIYYIFSTKKNVIRGFHAHKDLQQLAIAINGSCTFILDNGVERIEVLLDTPTKGLLINSLTWREMKDFSSDCVLLVLASNYYDESDYIRDYNVFLTEVHKHVSDK
ncbi:FdtA/QdtA family cupin domain-containing protein [Pantoea sp. GM01]|uniref:sugar 3,4-ketoisomerase n=1 Tax=Pantoea sp. GM01 TaxID=1144320 RepID=UPI0002714360|nr:FdtA/QdtA family cupin domain-containing protein [Pantoea sp. GM01]EJL89604.1 WxcM-like protein [Pantoea sp. GM01]